MITNLINYLYNIKIDYIRQINNGYIFFYDNNFYIFKEFSGDKVYFEKIINFSNKDDFNYHVVIKNKDNSFISFYQGISYILMRVKFNGNRRVLINDLFHNINIFYIIKKDDFFWKKLWSSKIDQVEQYVFNNINQFNIYVISVINYFLSLAELAINIYTNIDINYIKLSLCHRRMSHNMDLYEYFCVDDLVLDHYTRDVGEYIKSYIYSIDNNVELLKEYINGMSFEDRSLLLARILFPSYFFDLFDEYVLKGKNFSDFEVNFVSLSELNNNINQFLDDFLK